MNAVHLAGGSNVVKGKLGSFWQLAIMASMPLDFQFLRPGV